jgi:predicted transcriptional regulator
LTASQRTTLAGMEVHFNPDLQAKVNRVATENCSDPDEHVEQPVERYIYHKAWFREHVKKRVEQLDRGEFLTHEEVGARIEKLFRP